MRASATPTLAADLDGAGRARRGGAIAVEPLPPRRGGATPRARPAGAAAGARRRRAPSVAQAWRVSSFSGLGARRRALGRARRRGRPRPRRERRPRPRPARSPRRVGLHDFPRGRAPASCVHRIFETHRLRGSATTARCATLVARRAATVRRRAELGDPLSPRTLARRPRHAAAGRRGPLHAARRAARAPPQRAGVLFPVARRRRRRAADRRALADVFARHRRPATCADYAERLRRLPFRRRWRAFCKGFIDLVFEHDGRWYLSSTTSRTTSARGADDYAPRAAGGGDGAAPLRPAVPPLRRGAAPLPAAPRCPATTTSATVGGVFYLFVRGMAPTRPPGCGVFHDRPPLALVEALSAALDEPARGHDERRHSRRAARRAACCRRSTSTSPAPSARLGGERRAAVVLAAALASRQVGNGHVCLDLAAPDRGAAAARRRRRAGAAPTPGRTLERWLAALRGSPLVGRPTRRPRRRRWCSTRRAGSTCGATGSTSVRLAAAIAARAAAASIRASTRRLLRDGLRRLFPEPPGGEPDWQRVAACAAVQRRFCVISGGPGTGKTSTVVQASSRCWSSRRCSAAPRRRASRCSRRPARRRRASASRSSRPRAALAADAAVRAAIPDDAATIHRGLGARARRGAGFRHDARQPAARPTSCWSTRPRWSTWR